ncbi:tRNA uridine-5-carboxymethylaminomethyl(34) synthesis enzyme MnmG, partial [Treponema pallidum]
MGFRFSDYDVIVVGGGHAGAEAALAAARMGEHTLLITQTIDSIGRLSCNPSIGGISKGNIVREIDALGGEMGKFADACMIQYRLLNKSRGPAVQAPRIQADKFLYAQKVKYTLECTQHLHLYQDTVVDVVCSNTTDAGYVAYGAAHAVVTARGRRISARAVVLTTGTFMEGRVYIGEYEAPEGRLGEHAAEGLGAALRKKGFQMGRLKTGTPARVLRKSVDLSVMEKQEADAIMRPFSFAHVEINRPHADCYINYTNERTHQLIRENFHRSPFFSGRIKAVGTRYCPSIEDKVRKFPDRIRHQLYIEPEGLDTEELYINGLSSCLPEDIQDEMIRTIPGMERAVITRPAYAVDYAVLFPVQLGIDLQTKRVSGLFSAGQINGTSGYEEAGGQGIIAGINAALYARSTKTKEEYHPFVLKRDEAYIGVMIDDLVTQGIDEPYRMFTARAEYRLKLRHDTADERLTEKAYAIGLQKKSAVETLQKKMRTKHEILHLLQTNKVSLTHANAYVQLKPHIGKSFAATLRDPVIPLGLIASLNEQIAQFPLEVFQSVGVEIR